LNKYFIHKSKSKTVVNSAKPKVCVGFGHILFPVICIPVPSYFLLVRFFMNALDFSKLLFVFSLSSIFFFKLQCSTSNQPKIIIFYPRCFATYHAYTFLTCFVCILYLFQVTFKIPFFCYHLANSESKRWSWCMLHAKKLSVLLT